MRHASASHRMNQQVHVYFHVSQSRPQPVSRARGPAPSGFRWPTLTDGSPRAGPCRCLNLSPGLGPSSDPLCSPCMGGSGRLHTREALRALLAGVTGRRARLRDVTKSRSQSPGAPKEAPSPVSPCLPRYSTGLHPGFGS
uniref:Uncharacterized protein n=1 Tax=Molossus molossus TaxID=27622 RepID=A0A7J8CS22_MOLMO|nr:hypothetical protein HJG59_009828 [Molossus molossus]